MKHRITALLLTLALLLSAFPAAVFATQTECLQNLDHGNIPELTVLGICEGSEISNDPHTKGSYHDAIIPGPNMKGQHAQVGQLVVLEFEMRSFGATGCQYCVSVYEGTEINEDKLVAAAYDSFKGSVSTYYLELGWDTSVEGIKAGEYLVVSHTHQNGETYHEYKEKIVLTAENIPLESVYFVDTVTGLPVYDTGFGFGETRSFVLGYNPPNASTPDRRIVKAISDPAKLQTSGLCGAINIYAARCGEVTIGAYSAGQTAYLNITTEHHDYASDGICDCCSELAFKDVPKNAWYYGSVDYAVRNRLMNGIEKFIFAPDDPMTRAQLVTVLWRFVGEPAAGANPFVDVAEGLWYTQAVAWAAEKGIVTGVGNQRFDPDGKVSREQLVTILYRYSQMWGQNVSHRAELSGFPDAEQVSLWAKDAMQWAVAKGLVSGNAHSGNTWLEPQNSATRAQVAAILQRYITDANNP